MASRSETRIPEVALEDNGTSGGELLADPIPYVNCTSLSHSQLRSLPFARGAVAVICFALCLLVLIVLCCNKAWRSHLQRFVVYLTISSAIYLLTLTMQIEHYFDYPMKEEWQIKVCDTVGYLTELTGLIQLLYTFGVLHHLFAIYFNASFGTRYVCCCYKRTPRRDCTALCPDISFLFLSFLIAVVVTLPWLLTPYGESGPWCWIRSISVRCSESTQGLWEQIGLWYMPLGGLALFSLVLVGFILVFCVRGLSRYASARILVAVSSIIPYILVLVVYIVLCAVEMALNVVAPKVDKYWVWMLYAMLPPVSGVIIPAVQLVFHGPETVRAIVRFFCCIPRSARHISPNLIEQRSDTMMETFETCSA